MNCKNCKHMIKKNYYKDKKEKPYKHLHGGTYCRVSGFPKNVGGCLCNKPEPEERKEKMDKIIAAVLQYAKADSPDFKGDDMSDIEISIVEDYEDKLKERIREIMED